MPSKQAIEKDVTLAGHDDDAAVVGLDGSVLTVKVGERVQREECGNCGHDLSEYFDPEDPWKSMHRGRSHCKECPACGWDPTWYTGDVASCDANVICVCKTCGERNVQRQARQIWNHYLNGPFGKKRHRQVLRTGSTNDDCGACRENVQALIHYENYKRALKRASDKRESQRRGVAKFKPRSEG